MTAVIWVRQVIKKYAKFGWSTELSESPSEQRVAIKRHFLMQSISVGNILTFMKSVDKSKLCVSITYTTDVAP